MRRNQDSDSTNADGAMLDVDDAQETVVQSLSEMLEGFLAALPNLAIGLVVLLTTWGVSKGVVAIVRRVLARSRVRRSLQDLFGQLLYVLLWTGGLLVAAMVVFPGVTPGKVFTVLGLGSIAIGFAFKDIFENFFAGILILWRFPFETGDYIEVESVAGRVEKTTIRMTEIRRTDGQLVVLPNAHLFKNPVTVVTSRDRRRTTVICGVAYGEDVDRAREVIRDAVGGCESVIRDEEIQIFAREFGASSIDYEVTWWTGSKPVDERRSRDEVVAAVKRALDEAGIEIPFPYRTLTFAEPLVLERPAEAAGADESPRSGASDSSGPA